MRSGLYSGGIFQFRVKFPLNYPKYIPTLAFVGPVIPIHRLVNPINGILNFGEQIGSVMDMFENLWAMFQESGSTVKDGIISEEHYLQIKQCVMRSQQAVEENSLFGLSSVKEEEEEESHSKEEVLLEMRLRI